jgi:hypothetical protein
VFTLIDGELFRNTIFVGGIGVFPTRFKLFEWNGVGAVAINLIGGHVNERRFWTKLPSRFQYVKRTERVNLKIEERNGRSKVV